MSSSYLHRHRKPSIIKKEKLQELKKALRQSEERFITAFELTPMPITITQFKDGCIVNINKHYEDMLGYSRQEVIGHTALEFGLWVDAQQRVKLLDSLTNEGYVVGLEADVYAKSGQIHNIIFTSRLFEWANQTYIFTVYQDVTGRKEAERLLRESQEQLRQAQKMEAVGQLAGGIAHDFNNLLTGIIGYAEIMALYLAPTATLTDELDQIILAAERASELVKQLLVFSRKQIFQPTELNLNDVINNTQKILGRLINENIEITTHLRPELPTVLADRSQLEQIIINLAVNARDAMPEGGSLVFETSTAYLTEEQLINDYTELASGQYAVLEVSDTGVGMDKTTQQHIFEPFFTTKEVGKGTGLGLSTVYAIVKQNGGHIKIYSEVNKGTCFKVFLPACQLPATLVRSAQLQEVGSFKSSLYESFSSLQDRHEFGNAGLVLLVEDDVIVRALTCDTLKLYGYDVLEASNGPEALEVYKEFRGENFEASLGLLITDVVMPGGLNGRELAAKLQKFQPDLRILYISGYTRTIFEQDSLEQINLLQKPFTPYQLIKAVRENFAQS